MEYRISFPIQNDGNYVNIYFYTTDDHVNKHEQCSLKTFGQVKNDKMHNELNNRWDCCSRSANEMFCHCSLPIQDYIPRHLAFPFGFYCEDKTTKSLKGLTYNVTVYS